MEPCPGQPQEALLTVNEQVGPPCPPKPPWEGDPSVGNTCRAHLGLLQPWGLQGTL